MQCKSYNRRNKHTSISCTCSSLLTYMCCRESSSSLLRSRRVFPSSAAKCRSDRSQERGTNVNSRMWRGSQAHKVTSCDGLVTQEGSGQTLERNTFEHNHHECHCVQSASAQIILMQTCSHLHGYFTRRVKAYIIHLLWWKRSLAGLSRRRRILLALHTWSP